MPRITQKTTNRPCVEHPLLNQPDIWSNLSYQISEISRIQGSFLAYDNT